VIRTSGAAAAAQSRHDDAGDGAFQKQVSFSQSVIEPGAFIEFEFIQDFLLGQSMRRFAAVGAHGFNLARQPCGTSNR
jgi:hypothetical protein